LAYRTSGSSAIYAWVIDAALVVPLLFIFAHLGARFPSAGGIASFVEQAFGPSAGAAAAVMILGTFALGIPGIAVTGANYFAALLSPSKLLVAGATLLLLLLAATVNMLGAGLSGRVQQILAYSLVAILAAVSITSLLLAGHSHRGAVAPPASWPLAIPVLGSVFFAYTGWEMLAFTAEEYRNPRRDFPLSVGISFLIVTFLYLTIALAVQLTLSQTNPAAATAPIAALAAVLAGHAGASLLGAIGVVVIATNLIGATWAASRLAFSAARDGLLPRRLSALDHATGTPRLAVVAVVAVFLVIAGLTVSGVLTLGILFKLAGQNFFIMYGLAVLAYLKFARSWRSWFVGGLSLLLVVVTMGTFGVTLLYPLLLLAAGFALSRQRRAQRTLRSAGSSTSAVRGKGS
jgi:amino acid efflux transporter